MKSFTEYFDSIYEFEKACNTRPVNKVFAGACESISGSKDWTGTRNWDEATYFLRCGDWDKLGGMMDKCNTNPGFNMISDKVTPQVRHREYGGAVNVARYAQGNPQCMRRTERVHMQDDIVNIAYQFNMLSEEDPDQLVMNGFKVATLVNSLENLGFRVSLYVVGCSYKYDQYLTNIVKIKDSGAPLSLLALTYPVCNASFMRRHTFRWRETVPCEIDRDWRHSYGITERDPREIRKQIGTCLRGGYKLLTSYELKKCRNVQDLVKLINEQN